MDGNTDNKEKEIKALLKGKKIRPSIIRVKVLKYLLDNRNHPTADRLFSALENDIPTLSRTSIYNTLKTFLDEGVVSEITIEDGNSRYDAFTGKHGHFICEKCGGVSDFDVKCATCAPESLNGYKINQEHVYLRGLCPNCIKSGGDGNEKNFRKKRCKKSS
ncbi:MAG TPA: Fur family transcriptional regulator [Candidatus Goldiibacteriota bacterium]|nr:Fur family transcriptional regulator [Candidatus Goldiibacteriota bacterium]HRQ44864.1 Fur family transcriptional regulator [Candidatus Goldiibacteriota bacterium]